MEQCRKAQVSQFRFGIAGAVGQRHRQQRHIDRMIMRVLIVATKGRETEDRGFIIYHAVDDVLDCPLRLFKADRSSLAG